MLLITVDAVVASSSNPEEPIMNRDATHELTDTELDAVSGGNTSIQQWNNEMNSTNQQTTAQKAADRSDSYIRS